MKRGRASGGGAYSRTLAGEGGDTSSPAVQSLTPRVACGPRRKCPRLHPRPPRTEPLPQGVGRALLPEFVAQAAASLPSHTWRAICQHVSRHTSGPITIRVGTACSGSDFYLTALPHLEEELSKRLHRRIRFDHRWSCELDPPEAPVDCGQLCPKEVVRGLDTVGGRSLPRLFVRHVGGGRRGRHLDRGHQLQGRL